MNDDNLRFRDVFLLLRVPLAVRDRWRDRGKPGPQRRVRSLEEQRSAAQRERGLGNDESPPTR